MGQLPVIRPLKVGLANWISLVAALALGAVLGFGTLTASPIISRWSTYRLLFITWMGPLSVGLLVARNPRRILLMALVLATPSSLAYSPFSKDLAAHAGGSPAGVALYLYDFPLLGLAALWLLDTLRARDPIQLSGIDVVAVPLIAWSILSISNSSYIALGVFETLRLAKLYLLSLVVANHVRSRRDVQDVIVALLIGLAFQTVVGVLQYIGDFNLAIGPGVVGELRRVSGTLGWPNTLGAYIATSICVLLPLWLYGADRGFRIPIWVFLLVALFPLVWTLSRGAWNALLVGGAVSLFLGWHASLLKGRTTLNRVKAIGLSILVVSPLIAGSITARLRNPLDTFNTRVQLNQIALNMIRAHPFLGVGINTFVDVMRHYDTTGITRDFPQPVHNVFLLIAAETGVVGLGLFISLLLAAFWEGLQAIKYNDRFLSAVAIGILSGLAVLIVSNLVDVHLRTDALYALFWLLIGLVVSVRRMAVSSHLAGADGQV